MTQALSFDVVAEQAPVQIADYIALLKPRVMTLVIFTGFVGMWLAPGALHPVLAAVALLSLAVGAGAAGALNMWYDRDIDAMMVRTRTRPLPMGRIEADAAFSFGLVLSVLSVLTMALAVGYVAAGLLAFSIFFYAGVYTIGLKRLTPQNIVIGGAAGAFPPVIGWAAVTGDVTLFPVLLFLITFFWTPPHFWALALTAKEDYARAGIPMMPNVRGARHTQNLMVFYALLLFPVALSPAIFGYAGFYYGVVAALLSGFFVFTALRVRAAPTDQNAKLMFGYSIVYLFGIYIALMMGA